MVTRALEGTGKWLLTGGGFPLRGDGYALELDPCGCTTWWTVLKLNSVLHDKEFYAIWIWKERKAIYQEESSSKPWCCSSVPMYWRVSCVCSGRRLLFAAFWEHRPQPVSITSLAPYCPKLIFSGGGSPCPSQQGRTPHGVELVAGSHWGSAGSAVLISSSTWNWLWLDTCMRKPSSPWGKASGSCAFRGADEFSWQDSQHSNT